MAQKGVIRVGGHDAAHVLATAFYTEEDYKPEQYTVLLQRKLSRHNVGVKGGLPTGWHELTMTVEVMAREVTADGDRYGTEIEVQYALAKGAEPEEIDYEILFVIDWLANEIREAKLQEDLLNALA